MIESRDIAVLIGWQLYGTPYIWSGNDIQIDGGLDCSGFVRQVLRQTGQISLTEDLSAKAMLERFAANKIISPRPGCLAFYGESETEISHVMLFVSDEIVIGAVNGGRLTTSPAIAVAHHARVECRNYKYRVDLVAIVDPYKEVTNG